MSKKKKKNKTLLSGINESKELQMLLKDPAGVIPAITSKKGKIKGDKKTRKMVRLVCPHCIKKGNKMKVKMKPDGNGNMRCQICGDIIKPKFFSKEEVHSRTKKELEMISQGKLAAQSLGLPSSNVQDIALTYMAVHKYENTYNNIAEAVNKKDRIKRNKKNKNRGYQSYGSWS